MARVLPLFVCWLRIPTTSILPLSPFPAGLPPYPLRVDCGPVVRDATETLTNYRLQHLLPTGSSSRASVPEVQHNWAFRLSGQSMNCASGSLGSHRNRAVVSPPVVRPGCPGVRSPMATVDPTTAAAIERRMGKKRVSFAHLG